MKKQLAILLALLLVFPMILSACGDQQENVREQLGTRPQETFAPVREETTAPTDEETTAPTEVETTASTEAQTEAPTEETEAPAEETEALQEKKPNFPATLGQIQGNTYTNEYLGFGMELNDDWVLRGAAELQDIPANVAELMADTDIGDAIAGLDQIADMMAESSYGLATINTLYAKQSSLELAAHQSMSQEENVDFTLLQKDAMIRSYEQMGMEVESIEKVCIDFLGESTYGIKTACVIQEIPCYMLQLLFLDRGEYSVVLTFTSYMTDTTEDSVSLCYALA